MKSSVRLDRQLGLVTPQMQRYEAGVAYDWLEAINRQVCPFCNEGPFTVVASHVVAAHGICASELRDMLGVGRVSICDPTYSAAVTNRLRTVWSSERWSAEAAKRREQAKDPEVHERLVGQAQRGAQRAGAVQKERWARYRRVLADAYRSGASVDELAAWTGRPRNKIRYLLAREDIVPPRKPGRPRQMVEFHCAECQAVVNATRRQMVGRPEPWVCSMRCACIRRERNKRADP